MRQGHVVARRRPLRQILLLCAALVSAALPFSIGAAPVFALGTGYHTIHNVHSNLCLDDSGWSTSWGTQMQQWTCTGGSNQTWLIQGWTSVDWTCSDYTCPVWFYTIKNVYSGLCLDVKGNNDANGSPIIQWGCNLSDAAQQFRLGAYCGNGPSGGGDYEILPASNGYYPGYKVEVYNWSTSNGGKVDLWYQNGDGTNGIGANQCWW